MHRRSSDPTRLDTVVSTSAEFFGHTGYEKKFLKKFMQGSRKQRYQVYRAHKNGQLGDFVIVDLARKDNPRVIFLELLQEPATKTEGVKLFNSVKFSKDAGFIHSAHVTANEEQFFGSLKHLWQ